MEKLNKTFVKNATLHASELNAITGKVDELVEASNSSSEEIEELSETLGNLADDLASEIGSRQQAIYNETTAREAADAGLQAQIGDLDDIDTMAKDNVVEAVNEVAGRVDYTQAGLNDERTDRTTADAALWTAVNNAATKDEAKGIGVMANQYTAKRINLAGSGTVVLTQLNELLNGIGATTTLNDELNGILAIGLGGFTMSVHNIQLSASNQKYVQIAITPLGISDDGQSLNWGVENSNECVLVRRRDSNGWQPWKPLHQEIVGKLGDLHTTDKSSIVAAINEIDGAYITQAEADRQLSIACALSQYPYYKSSGKYVHDTQALRYQQWFNDSNVEEIYSLGTSRTQKFLSNLFRNATNLTKVYASAWDTSAVTTMVDMFYGCSSLTSLNLSGLDTSAVTTMASMFYGCSSLTSLNLSGWDTSAVTTMVDMFRGCSSLTSLNLSGLDTSAVTTMYAMFRGCSSLTSLNLSGLDTSAVTTMVDMFYGCSSLTSLNLSGLDTSAVTTMADMFRGCSSLTSLIGGSQDTTKACLNRLAVNLNMSGTNIDRASILAVFNGLADMSGQTAPTITLGNTLKAKLTNADKAIAIAKNWNIA